MVLGAPLRRGGLSDIGRDRVRGAWELWQRRAAPWVCVTGGVTGGESASGAGAGVRTEAAVMAEALVACGVPRSAIIVESTARHTADNARASAALLLPRGLRQIWLVTHPFHTRRARGLFRRAGFEVRMWSLEGSLQASDRPRALRWIVREYAAFVRGRLPGR